ncbi:DUF6328 family protein [Micromonospora sp. NPDC050980]|uniref:DUF6328 family protein n=1 Tax=Micromonospora sp. NPDC050980 TaxID=3155161 RepID=UPI0033E0051B
MSDQYRRDAAPDGRDESEQERADRHFDELLQELRVAQTGVQILFAFLLTLPFTQRFGILGDGQRAAYLTTLLLAAVATVCLIAPVNHHRILFHRDRKSDFVAAASRMALAGLSSLWLAIVGAVYLVIDVVMGTPAAVAVGAGLATAFVAVWYLLPMAQHARSAGQAASLARPRKPVDEPHEIRSAN